MNKLKLITVSIIFSSMAFGDVAVQDSKTQIKDAKSIVLGFFKEDKKDQIIFVVEESIKGDFKKEDKIIINESSRLAWRFVPGGGPMTPASREEFLQQIRQADWYKQKVVILGELNQGRWVSSCYDWSVWTSGKSTRDVEYKNMSLDELIEAIRLKLSPEKIQK